MRFVHQYVEEIHFLAFCRNSPRVRFGCASKRFLSGLIESVSRVTGIKLTIHKETIYVACCHGIKAHLFVAFLYSNSISFCIKRKQEIAKKILRWNPTWIKPGTINEKMLSFLFSLDIELFEKAKRLCK